MDRKAQLSFETIIIYGLIIVVVSLTVGSLIYFGVLDLGKLLPEKCNTGAPVVCETFALSTTSPNVQIEVRNKVGKRIDFLGGTLIRGVDDWTTSDCTAVTGTLPTSVGVDTTALLKFNCGFMDSTVVGQRYKATIVLEYKALGSQLAQKSTGSIFATIVS